MGNELQDTLKVFIIEKKTFEKDFYSWRDRKADFTKYFADLSIKKYPTLIN